MKSRLKFGLGALFVFLAGYAIGVNFAVCTFLVLLYAYFKFSHRDLSHKDYNLLNISLLFMVILVCADSIVARGWTRFYIPFSIIPMLSALLFGELSVSLLITLASAITVSNISGNDFFLAVMFLVSGILSSILVNGARRRIAIIRAGLIVGIVQAACLVFAEGFTVAAPDRHLALLLNGIASSIIVVGILPVFEYLFRIATNISLLELADFDHPLLQRMIIEAPGTYHHSLIVGNLSEAACNAIGAHALLARIGGYYHDIGKLSKPQYFSENQAMTDNRHEKLSAAMSKMVIMNHVKEGLELARRHKLNRRLLDFIVQHHGTSLVYYFWRRALEVVEEDQKVAEEGFRYPGPKPRTQEAAIVLLADSVEAATRALKDPAPAKIEEVVHKVINNKFIDGQLDECDLTLRDLEKISEVFIRILNGIYHSRITYPEEKS